MLYIVNNKYIIYNSIVLKLMKQEQKGNREKKRPIVCVSVCVA